MTVELNRRVLTAQPPAQAQEPTASSVITYNLVPPPPNAGAVLKFLKSGAILTVVALSFTVITYFADARSQDRADERAARVQLSQLMQSLADLQRTFGDEVEDPVMQSSYTEQVLFLTTQAERIADEWPSLVTTSDAYMLGSAYFNVLQDPKRAVDLLVPAESQAVAEDHPLVATAIRRVLGAGHLLHGHAAEGREWFTRAFAMENFTVSELVHYANALSTASMWITSEAAAGHCDEATAVYNKIRSLSVPPGVDASLAQASINSIATALLPCP